MSKAKAQANTLTSHQVTQVFNRQSIEWRMTVLLKPTMPQIVSSYWCVRYTKNAASKVQALTAEEDRWRLG